MKDVQLMFRQHQRKDDKMHKELSFSHHKFYKSMRTSKRDFDRDMEELATGEYGDFEEGLGRKIQNRVKVGDRQPIPLMKLEEDDDTVLKAAAKAERQQSPTKSSFDSRKSPSKRDSIIPQKVTKDAEIGLQMTLADEFEILFNE